MRAFDKDNIKDYLPTMIALSEGKTIQCRADRGIWCDITTIAFDCKAHNYRVKPEVITLYAILDKENKIVVSDVKSNCAVINGNRLVKFKEVLENE